jgi:hypothetical protein
MFIQPYGHQIFELWGVFSEARRITAQEVPHESNWFYSDYMVMDIFVVLFTSMELLVKSIYSFFCYFWLPTRNDSEWQAILADFYEKYVRDIETKPFFMHPYEKSLADLSLKWEMCQGAQLLELEQCPLGYESFFKSYSKDSVIKFEGELFYWDFLNQCLEEIKPNASQQEDYNRLLKACQTKTKIATLEELALIQKVTGHSKIRNLMDNLTWKWVSFELSMKAWLSKIMKADFKPVSDATQYVVSYSIVKNEKKSIEAFKKTVDEANARFLESLAPVPQPEIETREPIQCTTVFGRAEIEDIHIDDKLYARLSVPRYTTCVQALLELEKRGIQVQRVAGHEHLMVKAERFAVNTNDFQEKVATLKNVPATEFLYDYQVSANPLHKMCLFKVNAQHLESTVKKMHDIAPVKMIHNF